MARGMRFEGESAVWSRAARAIEDRVERSPAYAAAKVRAVALAVERLAPVYAMADPAARVAALRALGGNTAVAEGAVRDACAETPGALDEMGSKFLPASVRSLLLRRAADVRTTAQAALFATHGKEGGAP